MSSHKLVISVTDVVGLPDDDDDNLDVIVGTLGPTRAPAPTPQESQRHPMPPRRPLPLALLSPPSDPPGTFLSFKTVDSVVYRDSVEAGRLHNASVLRRPAPLPTSAAR